MLKTVIADQWRLLTFRQPSAAIATHWRAYLVFGLACTWLAGVGRYWDNPRAHLIQHLGLGSVIYAVCLALVLWLLIWPLRPKRWSYRNVLIFVCMTALPALLYAIPVERFMSMENAQTANLLFLAVVALWRVVLLQVFLRRVAELPKSVAVIATVLPLALIVVSLTALNLEHVVFAFMSGMEPEQISANDSAYVVVFLLSSLSILLSPLLLIVYSVQAYVSWEDRRASRRLHDI